FVSLSWLLARSWLLTSSRRKPAFQRQPHCLADRNSHDARVPVHPSVTGEHLVFVRAELAQVLTWRGLQPRLWRHAFALRNGERIFRRHALRLARGEVLEEEPHHETGADADDDEADAEAENGSDVDVARLVMDLGVLVCPVRVAAM